MIRNTQCYKCNGSLKEKCTLCGGTGKVSDSED
jgi:rRNA maturation protein Nop10